jgi:hypothetical protein
MDLSSAMWKKSTRSGNADCVEVADNLPGVVVGEQHLGKGDVLDG